MARYYYADGERQSLEPATDWLAIDARSTQDGPCEREVASLPVSSRLPGGMILVERRACSPTLQRGLETAGAVRPTFRYGQAVLVMLPEVRVELNAGQSEAVTRAIHASKIPAIIDTESTDRVALHPRSGKSEDALDLANYIYENARPAGSSVRFLQIVPKRLPAA